MSSHSSQTSVTLVDGAPGAGKTYTLRQRLEDEVVGGLDLDDFYWLNFTNAGREDVEPEIVEAYAGVETPEHITPEDRAKTFHGLALSLVIRREMIAADNVGAQVISQGQYYGDDRVNPYADFCRREGMSYDEDYEDPQKLLAGTDSTHHTGNLIFAISDYLTQTCKSPEQWRDAGITVPIESAAVERLLAAWHDYKLDPPHVDFRLFEHGDYVSLAAEARLIPDVDVLFVDEFQDLAPLEYKLYKLWRDYAGIRRVYVAGDPNQSVYSFRGGTPYYFRETDYDERIELDESRRCKSNIADFGREILDSHPGTDARDFRGHADGGVVRWRDIGNKYTLRDAVIGATDDYSGREGPSVLLLARTNRQRGKLTNALRAVGIPFDVLGTSGGVWRGDLAQMLSLLNNWSSGGSNYSTDNLAPILDALPETREYHRRSYGKEFGRVMDIEGIEHVFEDFSGPVDVINHLQIAAWKRDMLRNAVEAPASLEVGEVRVGTIHTAKGLEAPSVYLFSETTDSMVRRYSRRDEQAAEEHRVYYVGASRASDELTIVDGFFNGPRAPPLEAVRKRRISGQSTGVSR